MSFIAVPETRIANVNAAPVKRSGRFVLYWMITQRRTGWNFAFQRAVELAAELGRPLVLLEALRCDYPWASDRLHRFVLQGMADQQARLAGGPVTYYPYVERRPGEGSGLLPALADEACVVVTDDFPCFFLPSLVRAAARRVDVRVEAVDSNGLLPMRSAGRTFGRAVDFRRHLQKTLPLHLAELPLANPLAEVKLPQGAPISAQIRERWPAANGELLGGRREALAELPIDHAVIPAAFDGGTTVAERTWQRFLAARLDRYPDERNDPDHHAESGLSPYLHFGQISAHQVFADLAAREDWKPAHLARKATGQREGWWGMSPAAEAFLDQLVCWRELGYNQCVYDRHFDHFESLPAWAQRTLAEHERDQRPTVYAPAELESAATHDPLWNAGQNQLVREGRMHNYVRMLWGKKILQWSPSPREALAVMIQLNNKYAVDGRDPNSYSGILWVLGKFDRPWPPRRPIFGTVRYMSSENAARKLNLKEYVARYAK